MATRPEDCEDQRTGLLIVTMLNAALMLASRGLRVFPLIPGGKKPAIDDFPNRASTDAGVILKWWTDRPDCNIGVSTTGFVVADVDAKHGRPGIASFASVGGHYDTLVVKTPTGGYHCYFNGPDSKLAVDVMPGLDIRSHHGYVVGPGSVTSARYEDCVDGTYELVNDAVLAEVPLILSTLLEPPIRRVRHDDVELDKEVAISNAAVWLQNAEPAISGQGGNDSTYRVCAKLVRDFALSQETAYQLLLNHWNHRCVPPWPNGELWALVRNADEYGTADRGAALPQAHFGDVKVIEPPAAAPARTPQDAGVYMGNAPDPANLTPRPWKVDRLLMNGDVTVLGGMGAAGKSMLELVLAAHWALGLDFGAFKLRVPGVPLRSMIYNAEDDRGEQGRRLMAICAVYNLDYFQVRANIAFMDDRAFDLCLAAFAGGVPTIEQAAVQFVCDAAIQERVDVIIFDPLVNIHRCSENDNGQMRHVISVLRWIARQTNTAILCAHHTGKRTAQADKGDPDVFRGGGAIVNSARVAVLMSGITPEDAQTLGVSAQDKGKYVRIDNAKANYGPKVGEAILWLEWQSQKILTGDVIGVVKPFNAHKLKMSVSVEHARTIRNAIIDHGRGGINRTQAAQILATAFPLGFYATLKASTALRMIDREFGAPVDVDGERIVMKASADGRGKVLALEAI
jgi:hypothetical protein